MGCSLGGSACYLAETVISERPSERPIASSKGDDTAEPTEPNELSSFHDMYVVSTKLGKGAFASVHLVHRIGSPEKYVVKVSDLRVQKSGPFEGPVIPKRREAAEKEARMLRALQGEEHVIRISDSFTEGALNYIVMERADRTLLQALERMPDLTESGLAELFRGMLRGIAAAHAADVCHRDVKPDNFLAVGEDCTIKLCDFGLASMVSSGSGIQGIYGTPPYMAPEMLKEEKYGLKVDVWSFGVTAYVLLLGQFPYVPAKQNGPAMKAAIWADSPPPSFCQKAGLESVPRVAKASPEAVAAMRELIRRSPDERPSAAQAVGLFRDAPDPGEQRGSFRPMLFAAKRAGAFDNPGKELKGATDVDLYLSSQQELRHGAGALQKHHSEDSSKKVLLLPSESTDAGSLRQSDGLGQTEGSQAP